MLEEVKNQGKKDGGMENAAEEGAEGENGQQNNSSQSKAGQDKKNPVNSKAQNNYETAIVHRAISKISKVIAKVFGNNGKELIYEKIFDKGTVVENYLSKGKKYYCILGSCSIQNFGIIRDAIGHQTIGLCNQIGEYLHSAAFRYGGSAIMNGDGTFLLSFTCPEEHQPKRDQRTEQGGYTVKVFEKV